jgi:outer membrane protein TolC
MRTKSNHLPLAAALVVAAATASACTETAPAVPSAAPPPATSLPTAPPEVELAIAHLSGAWTLAAALERALTSHPDLALASARVDEARAELDGARARLLPVLTLDAGYLRADAPSTYLFKTIDARKLPAGVDFNDPGTFDNVEVGATLRWNLWSGGQDALRIEAADSALSANVATRRAREEALASAVVAAFLDLRATGELLVADEASLRAVQSQVEEVRTRVAGGAALRSDLLSLEVRAAEAEARRIRDDVARRLAQSALRRLLALPPDAPVELSSAPFEEERLPETAADARVAAHEGRPDLLAARRTAAAAEREHEAARRSWLPSLDFYARGWADDGNAELDFERANWSAGIGLTFDLYDGSWRAAERRRAAAVEEEAAAAVRRIELDVEFDVEQAWLAREEARARLAVAERAVAAADESLALVAAQFRGGSANVTRFLDAEAAQTQAKTSLIQAQLDLDRANAQAARALGLLAQRRSGRSKSHDR